MLRMCKIMVEAFEVQHKMQYRYDLLRGKLLNEVDENQAPRHRYRLVVPSR
jgi:hypothetical protein